MNYAAIALDMVRDCGRDPEYWLYRPFALVTALHRQVSRRRQRENGNPDPEYRAAILAYCDLRDRLCRGPH